MGDAPKGFWESVSDNQQQADYLKQKAQMAKAKAAIIRDRHRIK